MASENIIFPNDGGIHALGGGILAPYGTSPDMLPTYVANAQDDFNHLGPSPNAIPNALMNNYNPYSHFFAGQPTDFQRTQNTVNAMKQHAASKTIQAAQSIPSTAPTMAPPSMKRSTVSDLLSTNRNKKIWDIESPTDEDITKRMWINSFIGALAAGMSSGNAGVGIAYGMLGALTTHDAGYNQKARNDHAQELLNEGYSYGAVLQWVRTGDAKMLEKDDDRMERAHEADQKNEMMTNWYNDQAMNQNIRAQAQAEREGYDVVMPDGSLSSNGFADIIKRLEGGTEHVTNSAGASGVYQQKQAFWDENKPSSAPVNVEDATESQQRQATINFYNKLKEQGYTDEEIVAAYNQGQGAVNSALRNGGANWVGMLKPEGQNYVRKASEYINNGYPLLVDNGKGSVSERAAALRKGGLNANGGGQGLITTADGIQHQVAVTASGAPKAYGNATSGYYYVDSMTGEQIPAENVVSRMTPSQKAQSNLMNSDLNIIQNSPDDAYTPIVGQIQTWWNGSDKPGTGADIFTAASGGQSRELYNAANRVNGYMLTRGVSAAKNMGASGINSAYEAEMYFAAMPKLDFSSEEALKASAKRIADYTDAWNSAHPDYSSNEQSSHGTAIGNNIVSDSDRSALGY